MTHSFVDIERLSKSYRIGDGEMVPVLDDISLTIDEGEFVSIMGRSGSGKSTFMNILGTLDTPSEGHYWLNGMEVSGLDREELAYVRNRTIGFVFQHFNLIPRRTVLDNVGMPLLYSGVSRARRHAMAMSYMEMVGLADLANRVPSQLSGGQQQRVAIARALVSGPKLILADEPTGNLDSKTAEEIMEILKVINDARITIVLVTHEPTTAAYAQRMIHFKDGKVSG